MNDELKEIRQCDIDTTGPNSLGKLLIGKTAKEQDAIEEEYRQCGKSKGDKSDASTQK
jgi:hypothetical protein